MPIADSRTVTPQWQAQPWGYSLVREAGITDPEGLIRVLRRDCPQDVALGATYRENIKKYACPTGDKWAQ